MKIAVVPGDGIGPEVIGEAIKVIDRLNQIGATKITWEELPYSADSLLEMGALPTADELKQVGVRFDAILLGALGDPRIPDDRHIRAVLLGFRFHLDLYINFRPARLLAPRLSPLKAPGAIDLAIFRENTEGLYAGVGGRIRQGTPQEVAIASSINTRHAIERIVRAAFQWAAENGRRRVTLIDKANAVPQAYGLWRDVFEAVASEYPDLTADQRYVDAMAMLLVREPHAYEVIVTDNFVGDILSDLAAEIIGGPGLAPSANLHPGRPGLFEPVHGSATGLAGQDRANPFGAVLSSALMLDELGLPEAASAVRGTVEAAVETGATTPDLGGELGTRAAGDWLVEHLEAHLS